MCSLGVLRGEREQGKDAGKAKKEPLINSLLKRDEKKLISGCPI
jgi:hypothetical protein